MRPELAIEILNDPADAALDADGDGLTNRQELLAGTHPRNAQSTLRIEAAYTVQAATKRLVLRFSIVAGKSYSIDCRDNLNAPWTRLLNTCHGHFEHHQSHSRKRPAAILPGCHTTPAVE